VTLPVCFSKDSSNSKPVLRAKTVSEDTEVYAEPISEDRKTGTESIEKVAAKPQSCPIFACFGSTSTATKENLKALDGEAAAGMTGIRLLRAALGFTESSQEDAQPFRRCSSSTSSQPSDEAENTSPLSPHNGKAIRKAMASSSQSNGQPKVEENQDPNTLAILEAAKKEVDAIIASGSEMKAKNASSGKPLAAGSKGAPLQKVRPPAQSENIQDLIETASRAVNEKQAVLQKPEQPQPCLRGNTPRYPPNSWHHDKVVVSVEECWMRLDGLRVRMEMLPGGLVIERDTNLTEIGEIIADIQKGEAEPSEGVSASQAQKKIAEINNRLMYLSELVEAVEAEYWNWCIDANAVPDDKSAKQQVHDWLSHTGEKAMVLVQLRELGARRCIGAAGLAGEDPQPCRKFLQYGLYKSKVRRCPTCSKESKKLVACGASEVIRLSVASEEEPDLPVRKSSSVCFDEAPPSSITVEARELAWAPYAACPDTYFRAYVVPNDLAISLENSTPINVSWLDGDRRHRAVQAKDVTLMDDPIASDVKFSQAATWDKASGCLVPRMALK
jgi:hypothetical protein